jgi:acyl carrier protein
MTAEEIRIHVLHALSAVAPEADLGAIEPATSLRDQYDLDSVDFLNFIVGIHAETGVDIPEVDYPKLTTLDDCVAYLARALGGRSA